MATGAPAATELGVWDGSRRGSKSAADDEAAGDLLLKLQEGGAKVVAINRMADPVLRKAAASQQLREKLEANAAKAVPRAPQDAPGCAVAGGGRHGHCRRGLVHSEQYDASGGRRRCRIPVCVGFQEYHVRRLKSNLKKNVEL